MHVGEGRQLKDTKAILPQEMCQLPALLTVRKCHAYKE